MRGGEDSARTVETECFSDLVPGSTAARLGAPVSTRHSGSLHAVCKCGGVGVWADPGLRSRPGADLLLCKLCEYVSASIWGAVMSLGKKEGVREFQSGAGVVVM